MRKFFAERTTRLWVRFFVIAQLGAFVLFIVALFGANDFMDKSGLFNAYFMVYSLLDIILYVFTGPTYFSPFLAVFWLPPLILIYPYSLFWGALAAYIQKRIKRQ